MAALKGQAQRPHFTHRTRGNTSWQEHAACVDANPNIFFDPERYADALAFCRECPVQAPCRELGRGQADGVWGNRIHQRYSRRRD